MSPSGVERVDEIQMQVVFGHARVGHAGPTPSGPSNVTVGISMFWNENPTCVNGACAVVRGGFSTSTRRSNGMSAFSKAARSVART